MMVCGSRNLNKEVKNWKNKLKKNIFRGSSPNLIYTKATTTKAEELDTDSKNQPSDVYKKILQPFVLGSLLTGGFATSLQPEYQLFNFFTLLLDRVHKAKMWFSSCCSLGTVQAGELFQLAKCLKRHHSNQSSLHFHMEGTSHAAVTPSQCENIFSSHKGYFAHKFQKAQVCNNTASIWWFPVISQNDN